MLKRFVVHINVIVVLLALLILAAGCGPGPAQPTEAPTAHPTELPTPTPTEAAVEIPDEVRAARDAALAYIVELYPDDAPTPGLTWAEERTTPEGLVGSETFEYTADDWTVTISYPVVAPENVIYQIVVENPTTGFKWEGKLDAGGSLTETAAPMEGDFQPLSATACSDLADAMAQTLGVDPMTEEAPFEDYISRKTGRGCQITAGGTGLDFESFQSVFEELKAMLTAQGWQEDMMYQADGPTGTGTGFHKEQGLCLLTVGWEPSEDAECPTDKPIYECELTPEQQIYTIVLNCAEAAEDQYEGWDTYMSEKFGYTLKYPGDAEVMGTDLDQSVQFVGPIVNDEHWPYFSVDHNDSDFYHPPVGTDVRQWIADSGISDQEMGPEVEIAGLPAVHLIFKGSPQAYAFDEYYFIKGDQLFHIIILHTGGQQDWELYNKFLKSFTFAAEATVEGQPLTLEALKNAAYFSEWPADGVAQLVDGKYQEEYEEGAASELFIVFTDMYAFGDLDGDGVEDAAVVLATSGGGSGLFMSLEAVINDGGTPHHVATAFLGDRVELKSISIESGVITVDMVTHGPDDPMCCPTLEVTQEYELQGDQLVQPSEGG